MTFSSWPWSTKSVSLLALYVGSVARHYWFWLPRCVKCSCETATGRQHPHDVQYSRNLSFHIFSYSSTSHCVDMQPASGCAAKPRSSGWKPLAAARSSQPKANDKMLLSLMQPAHPL